MTPPPSLFVTRVVGGVRYRRMLQLDPKLLCCAHPPIIWPCIHPAVSATERECHGSRRSPEAVSTAPQMYPAPLLSNATRVPLHFSHADLQEAVGAAPQAAPNGGVRSDGSRSKRCFRGGAVGTAPWHGGFGSGGSISGFVGIRGEPVGTSSPHGFQGGRDRMMIHR